DAAGGEVGDAAGVELQAHVGDIDLAGDDGQAHGAHLADRRLSEGEHDVEIVHHEVEHHVYVERARAEDAEAMRFKEHRLVADGFGGGDGGIEAFEMADLEDTAAAGGEIDELVGFGGS